MGKWKRIFWKEKENGDYTGAAIDSSTGLIHIHQKLLGKERIIYVYPHELKTILDNYKDGVEE